MRAKQRKPAHFVVEGRSSILRGENLVWKVVCSTHGMVATQYPTGRRVSIGWREMIGLAMFHGHDSARDTSS